MSSRMYSLGAGSAKQFMLSPLLPLLLLLCLLFCKGARRLLKSVVCSARGKKVDAPVTHREAYTLFLILKPSEQATTTSYIASTIAAGRMPPLSPPPPTPRRGLPRPFPFRSFDHA